MFALDTVSNLPPQAGPIGQNLLILIISAGLGAALGVLRPVRNEIIPRSAHVIHAQILLSIVGAMIIVVAAESLARASGVGMIAAFGAARMLKVGMVFLPSIALSQAQPALSDNAIRAIVEENSIFDDAAVAVDNGVVTLTGRVTCRTRPTRLSTSLRASKGCSRSTTSFARCRSRASTTSCVSELRGRFTAIPRSGILPSRSIHRCTSWWNPAALH